MAPNATREKIVKMAKRKRQGMEREREKKGNVFGVVSFNSPTVRALDLPNVQMKQYGG